MELLLANAQGQALIDGAQGFLLNAGRLLADDPAIHNHLRALAAGRGTERTLTFSLKGRNGEKLLITALAVDQGQSGQFANRAGGTTLMIIGGQRMGVSDTLIDALQSGFDLTAAEARLAAYLIEGSGVHGYAEARGVSVEAGKYLLKSIYAKTGMSKQSDLIALLREVPLGWGGPLS